jgi:hypothetical protein
MKSTTYVPEVLNLSCIFCGFNNLENFLMSVSTNQALRYKNSCCDALLSNGC